MRQDSAAEYTGGTSLQLTVNDFKHVYGREFINANQNYVENFLSGLNQRKSVFKGICHLQIKVYSKSHIIYSKQYLLS